MTKKLYLLIAFLFYAQTVSAVDIQLERCTQAKGTIPTKSLDNGQAKKYRQWVIRCAPKFNIQLSHNSRATYQGNKYWLYPIFGILSTVVDETSDTGIKFVYSDPLNYRVNFAAVLGDPQTAPCDIPEDYEIVAFCRAGCYTPDQLLLVNPVIDREDSWLNLQAAEQNAVPQVATLTSDSTLDNIQLKSSKVLSYTVDPEDRQQKIVIVRTKSGGELKLTTNHPLVVSTGKIKEAEEIEMGDELLTAEGLSDPVVAVETVEYFGKVYNVDIDSENNLENIVVAQGYLNGSSRYQNEYHTFMNRMLIRKSLIPVEILGDI